MRELELRFENLSAGYRKPLLEPLTGVIPRNRLTLLLGENGSGKSTLLKTLAGLIPPLAGTLAWGDTDLSVIPPAGLARFRAFVSGGWIDPGTPTLYDFAALGRIPCPDRTRDHGAIMEALEAVGLGGREDDNPSRISDGERQKGKIARALCQETPLLILDEPDSHLDIRAREELMALLAKLAGTGGKTIIFSSHDLLTALGAADRCLMIREKKLIVYEKGELSPEKARDCFRQGFSSYPSPQPR
jgi:iron complex transport system ATP-binding protein